MRTAVVLLVLCVVFCNHVNPQELDACGVPGGSATTVPTLFITADQAAPALPTGLYAYQGLGTPQFLRPTTPITTPSTRAIEFNGRYFFACTDGPFGQELCFSDAKPGVTQYGGTKLFKDLYPGATSSNPDWFVKVNGYFFFVATHPTQGRELWISDGTVDGTVLFQDIRVGSGNSDPAWLTPVWMTQNGKGPTDNITIALAATSLTTGRELCFATAPPATAFTCEDIRLGTASSSPNNLIHTRGRLVMMATSDAFLGEEPHTKILFNGTSTYLLRDMTQGTNGSNIAWTLATQQLDGTPGQGAFMSLSVNVVDLDNVTQPAIDAGQELVLTDSETARGTGVVADFNPGPPSGNPQPGVFMNRNLFLIADNGTAVQLFTRDVINISPGVNASTEECVEDIRECYEGSANIELPNGTFVDVPRTICQVLYDCTPVPGTEFAFGIPRFIPMTEYLGIGDTYVAHQAVNLEDTSLVVDAESPGVGREFHFVDAERTSYTVGVELVPGAGGVHDVGLMGVYDGAVYAPVKVTPSAAYDLYKITPTAITLIESSFATDVQAWFVANLLPYDDCGVCNGLNLDKDVCGECFGNGSLCSADCFGVPLGPGVLDACGDCRNGFGDPEFNFGCLDCNAVLFGGAVEDGCGECWLNGTSSPCFNQSCVDCAGVVNGTAQLDMCGVCNGDNSLCVDCAGTFHIERVLDPPEQAQYLNEYFLSIQNCSNVTRPFTTEVCATTNVSCGEIGAFTPVAELMDLGCYPSGVFTPELQIFIPLLDQCQDVPVTEEVCLMCGNYTAQVDAIVNATSCYNATSMVLNFTCVYDEIAGASIPTACLTFDTNMTTIFVNASIPGEQCVNITLFNTTEECDPINATEICVPPTSVIPTQLVPCTEVELAPPVVITANCSVNGTEPPCCTDPGNELQVNNATLCNLNPYEPPCLGFTCNATLYIENAIANVSNTTTAVHTSACLPPGTLIGTSLSPTQCINSTCYADVPVFVPLGLPFLVENECGICNSTDTACFDCNNTPNGTAIIDPCGQCLLPDSPLFNTSCADCFGTPFGIGIEDFCGACYLPGDPFINTTCTDCNGVIGGGAVVDVCGVCGGTGGLCTGCDGVLYGSATLDACGVCRNLTDPLFDVGCDDCFGVPGGGATIGICGCNDNTSCVDCLGIVNGTAITDICGECFNTTSNPLFNNTCPDCFGNPGGGAVNDACGVCGGNNATCLDCAGVPNGGAMILACGCADATSCLDCAGVPFGTSTTDLCGECNGNNTACLGK